MRRYGIGKSMLAVACVTAMMAAQVAEPKRYALVVGINQYSHDDFDDLRYCENDAKEIAKRFTDAKYDEVVVIRGKEATRDKIMSELKRLVKKHKVNDTIVVSLTGHGIHFSDATGTEKDSHFCPYDAIPKFDKRKETLISMSEIYDEFGNAKRGPKMLLVDACRNFVSKRGVDAATAPRPPTGVLTYFSCSQGQFSMEAPALKHGLFTYALLEALDGKGGVNEDGEVTWARLMEYVPKRVAKLQQEHVKFQGTDERFIQEPNTNADLRGLPPVLLKPNRLSAPVASEERSIDIADGVKMVLCYIPAGKAKLGSPMSEKDRSDDEAEHEYETKGCWLGKYEVTQDQWTAVMGSTPSYFRVGGRGEKAITGLQTGRHPVEQVSWEDCQKFLAKVNSRVGFRASLGGTQDARLPHEHEWEYAYRGGKGNDRAFYWGDISNANKANHNGNEPYGTATKGISLGRTTPVGTYETKAKHPWGLCDMSGNVYEWCDNIYGDEKTYRSVRGGAWKLPGFACRGASRFYIPQSFANESVGFRLLLPSD